MFPSKVAPWPSCRRSYRNSSAYGLAVNPASSYRRVLIQGTTYVCACAVDAGLGDWLVSDRQQLTVSLVVRQV